jgi:hypothetical protein
VPDLAKILFGWLLLAIACQGLGRIAARALIGRRARALSAFQVHWLGFAAALAIVQLWHLFAPVDWRASALVLGVGVLGIAKFRARRPHATPTLALWAAIVAGLATWVAFYALGVPAEYDSGLYHFHAVRWQNEHAIVPGLGNLHFRLAFNNSSFGFVALCNAHPWFGHGHNLANSFLIVALLAQGCWAALRLVRGRIDAALVLQAAFLPVALLVVSNAISSPSTDRPVLAVALAMAAVAVEAVHRGSTSRRRALLTVACVLGAAAVTLKLSAAATCGALLLFAGIGRSPRWLVRGALAAAILLAPWAVRGVVTSGYPAYPSTLCAIDVDWRIPAAEVDARRLDTYTWARDYGADPRADLPLRAWFPAWRDRALATKEVRAALLGAVVGAAMWLAAIGLAGARAALLRCLVLWIPALFGVGFWFLTAPDPRFGAIPLWLTGLLPAACAAPLLRARLPWIARVLAVGALAGAIGALARPRPHDWSLLDPFRPIPSPPLREFRTDSELLLLAPEKGDQVWDAPLPATPYPRRALALRGEGLAGGFRVR